MEADSEIIRALDQIGDVHPEHRETIEQAVQHLRGMEEDYSNLLRERDGAVKTFVRMGEAFVNAGYPGGDRDVVLANVERALGKRVDVVQAAREEALRAAARCAAKWRQPAEIRLRAGELTAQEMRTARAIAGGIERDIIAIAVDPKAGRDG